MHHDPDDPLWLGRFDFEWRDDPKEAQPPIRVMLAVEPQLLRESLRAVIEKQADVRIVAEALPLHPMHVLFAAASSDATLVILSAPSVEQMPPLATLLLESIPELCVVGIDADGEHVTVWRRVVVRQDFPTKSITNLPTLVLTKLEAPQPLAPGS